MSAVSSCTALVVRGRGRPRTENEAQLKDSLCALIAEGQTRMEACQQLGLGYSTIGQWLVEDADFAAVYARARAEMTHHLAERAVTLSRIRPLTMPEAAGQRAELDTIKWFTSKIAPRIYGERVIQDHSHTVGVVMLPQLPESQVEPGTREPASVATLVK